MSDGETKAQSRGAMPAIPQLHLYIQRGYTPSHNHTAREGRRMGYSDGSPCSPEAFVTPRSSWGCVSKAARDAGLCPGH